MTGGFTCSGGWPRDPYRRGRVHLTGARTNAVEVSYRRGVLEVRIPFHERVTRSNSVERSAE